jgi:hypothetical protein
MFFDIRKEKLEKKLTTFHLFIIRLTLVLLQNGVANDLTLCHDSRAINKHDIIALFLLQFLLISLIDSMGFIELDSLFRERISYPNFIGLAVY